MLSICRWKLPSARISICTFAAVQSADSFNLLRLRSLPILCIVCLPFPLSRSVPLLTVHLHLAHLPPCSLSLSFFLFVSRLPILLYPCPSSLSYTGHSLSFHIRHDISSHLLPARLWRSSPLLWRIWQPNRFHRYSASLNPENCSVHAHKSNNPLYQLKSARNLVFVLHTAQ